MRIHKEGFLISFIAFILLTFLNGLVYYLFIGFPIVTNIFFIISMVFFIFILTFFRKPLRRTKIDTSLIYSPADGEIVAIEEIMEDEYFKDARIQVSVFMSPLNVHINWYPIGGIIKYFQYHKGKYLVAWHPKSSTENERTSTVIEDSMVHKIMVRQIAGFVARRIVSYAKMNNEVYQGKELGFIKFGSRVDVILPKDSKIVVKLQDKVKGGETVLAVFA